MHESNRKSVIAWLKHHITNDHIEDMEFKKFRYRFYYREGVTYCVPMSEHAHLKALVNEVYSYAVQDGLFETELGTLAPFKLN